MKMTTRKRRSVCATLTTLVMALFLTCAFQACGRQPGKHGNTVTLILGGYTTPREAYGKAVIPAFQKYWKEKTGQDVQFQESYQGSGAQSRAIIGGVEDDVTALSLEGDGVKIAQEGVITQRRRAKTETGEGTR